MIFNNFGLFYLIYYECLSTRISKHITRHSYASRKTHETGNTLQDNYPYQRRQMLYLHQDGGRMQGRQEAVPSQALGIAE